jgi:hypothetical protein
MLDVRRYSRMIRPILAVAAAVKLYHNNEHHQS